MSSQQIVISMLMLAIKWQISSTNGSAHMDDADPLKHGIRSHSSSILFRFFFYLFQYNCYVLQLFANFVLHCIPFSTWTCDRAIWIRCQNLRHGFLLCKSCTLAKADTKNINRKENQKRKTKKKKELRKSVRAVLQDIKCGVFNICLAIDNANSILAS